MTDVRLTALNPEDSQVYPVACNTSGELKLEKQATFDGNLDGELTVSSSGTFYGPVTADRTSGTARAFSAFLNGTEKTRIQADGSIFVGGNNASAPIQLSNTGTASFSGDIQAGGDPQGGVEEGSKLFSNGSINATRTRGDFNVWTGYTAGTSTATSKILANGSASFSGDVVIGSRSKQWMLVEQGGLCHMVEQVRATTADLVDPAAAAVAAEYPKLRDVFKELNTIERCLEEVMTKLRMTEPDGWPVWDGSDNSR